MSEADLLSCTPPEITEIAKATVDQLVPTKSSEVYRLAYEKFLKWRAQNKVIIASENVLLAYFAHLSRKMKSSSLWSHYSMIKCLLNIKENVDISRYLKLRAFLKKQSVGYRPKQAPVLSKEQIDKFIFEAPDVKYLATKVHFCYIYNRQQKIKFYFFRLL